MARLEFENGNNYEGDLVKGEPHGKGKGTFASGDVYDGDWVGGNMHGKGKYIWADGSVYEGDYVDGKKHGKGKYTQADGSIYEGDFVDGERNGKGKYAFVNGDVFEGDYVDGKYYGKGKYTYLNGNFYEGDFVDDKQHGKGKYTYTSGDVYEGDLFDGKKHGKGKMTYANGDVYEGDWVDDERNGKGKLTLADGSVYEGDFIDGEYNGEGKNTNENGDAVDETPHGKGKLTSTDDDVRRKYFEEGLKSYENGDLGSADFNFRMASVKNPEYLYWCGKVIRERSKDNDFVDRPKNLKESIDCLRKAVKLNSIAKYRFELGIALSELGSFNEANHISGEKDYTKEALDIFDKLIEEDNSIPGYYLQRSYIYSAYNKNEEALKDLNIALKLDDANAKCFFWRGRVNEQLGKYEEAYKDYVYALHLDDSVPAHIGQLGMFCKNHLKDYEKAYECLKKAKEMETNHDLLECYDEVIQECIRFGNLKIEPEPNETNYEQEETFFGKIMNVAKNGFTQLSNEYSKKLEKIKKYKERLQYKDSYELRQIMMNSNVFEEKVAAKRLLEEMGEN